MSNLKEFGEAQERITKEINPVYESIPSFFFEENLESGATVSSTSADDDFVTRCGDSVDLQFAESCRRMREIFGEKIITHIHITDEFQQKIFLEMMCVDEIAERLDQKLTSARELIAEIIHKPFVESSDNDEFPKLVADIDAEGNSIILPPTIFPEAQLYADIRNSNCVDEVNKKSFNEFSAQFPFNSSFLITSKSAPVNEEVDDSTRFLQSQISIAAAPDANDLTRTNQFIILKNSIRFGDCVFILFHSAHNIFDRGKIGVITSDSSEPLLLISNPNFGYQIYFWFIYYPAFWCVDDANYPSANELLVNMPIGKSVWIPESGGKNFSAILCSVSWYAINHSLLCELYPSACVHIIGGVIDRGKRFLIFTLLGIYSDHFIFEDVLTLLFGVWIMFVWMCFGVGSGAGEQLLLEWIRLDALEYTSTLFAVLTLWRGAAFSLLQLKPGFLLRFAVPFVGPIDVSQTQLVSCEEFFAADVGGVWCVNGQLLMTRLEMARVHALKFFLLLVYALLCSVMVQQIFTMAYFTFLWMVFLPSCFVPHGNLCYQFHPMYRPLKIYSWQKYLTLVQIFLGYPSERVFLWWGSGHQSMNYFQWFISLEHIHWIPSGCSHVFSWFAWLLNVLWFWYMDWSKDTTLLVQQQGSMSELHQHSQWQINMVSTLNRTATTATRSVLTIFQVHHSYQFVETEISASLVATIQMLGMFSPKLLVFTAPLQLSVELGKPGSKHYSEFLKWKFRMGELRFKAMVVLWCGEPKLAYESCYSSQMITFFLHQMKVPCHTRAAIFATVWLFFSPYLVLIVISLVLHMLIWMTLVKWKFKWYSSKFWSMRRWKFRLNSTVGSGVVFSVVHPTCKWSFHCTQGGLAVFSALVMIWVQILSWRLNCCQFCYCGLSSGDGTIWCPTQLSSTGFEDADQILFKGFLRWKFRFFSTVNCCSKVHRSCIQLVITSRDFQQLWHQEWRCNIGYHNFWSMGLCAVTYWLLKFFWPDTLIVATEYIQGRVLLDTPALKHQQHARLYIPSVLDTVLTWECKPVSGVFALHWMVFFVWRFHLFLHWTVPRICLLVILLIALDSRLVEINFTTDNRCLALNRTAARTAGILLSVCMNGTVSNLPQGRVLFLLVSFLVASNWKRIQLKTLQNLVILLITLPDAPEDSHIALHQQMGYGDNGLVFIVPSTWVQMTNSTIWAWVWKSMVQVSYWFTQSFFFVVLEGRLCCIIVFPRYFPSLRTRIFLRGRECHVPMGVRRVVVSPYPTWWVSFRESTYGVIPSRWISLTRVTIRVTLIFSRRRVFSLTLPFISVIMNIV